MLAGMKRLISAGHAALSVVCLAAAVTAALFPRIAKAAEFPSVTVVATVPEAALDGSATGLLTFARTGDTSNNLTVNYILGGSAAKWTDYYRLPEGDMPVAVTIPAGAASTTLAITANGNSTGANPETALFTLSADPSYSVGAANAAAVTIVAAGAATAPLSPTVPVASVVPANAAGSGSAPGGNEMDDTNLVLAAVGDHALRVLAPTLLELRQITTKAPDPAIVSSWNLVGANGQPVSPAPTRFTVTVDGQTVAVTAVGFRRRVFYAPLKAYDLRLDNALYLRLAQPVADGQAVEVTNPDGQIWASSDIFTVAADPLRYSPAIHVNQEGYVPSFPKKAMIAYYLGAMGEMPVTAAGFSIIDVTTDAVVFQGALTQRQDVGYQTTPAPYQNVYVADFGSFVTPGEYRLQVAGMGTSLPFVINDGIAMAFARTYALGMYGQRSGSAATLPYTRFTHAADHTAPAQVPASDSDPQFAFTWNCIAGYAGVANANNPAQTAPLLTSAAKALYPFVNTGSIDVS